MAGLEGGKVKVSKTAFRYIVVGGEYHDSDYLYSLR
ncbi:hypothetical protein VP495E541_P0252 [Vibrio phage 495E54-1]|nr:hypothetical protein VP495E541_P0252 [Vibrio phage 495E54-1]